MEIVKLNLIYNVINCLLQQAKALHTPHFYSPRHASFFLNFHIMTDFVMVYHIKSP